MKTNEYADPRLTSDKVVDGVLKDLTVGISSDATYKELERQIQVLLDGHGLKDFLLATVATLDSNGYQEESDGINWVRLDLGHGE